MRILMFAAAAAALTSAPARADPAPPNAAYFADCLAASAAAKAYDRDGRYLRFTCSGLVAQAFFEALGKRPPAVAYEEHPAGANVRFTEKPKKNTDGLDYCREDLTRSAPERYSCVLIYPAGAFLDR